MDILSLDMIFAEIRLHQTGRWPWEKVNVAISVVVQKIFVRKR
jgi:hypothetical protein